MKARPSEFDPARIAALKRGSKILVMDRVTGKSVYVPEENGRLLGLVGSAEKYLPGELIALRRKAIEELAVCGIGVAPPRRFDALNTVILKLTTACNYACTYCYDYEPQERAANLELAVACDLLEQALDLCSGPLQVILHGGEPFLMFENIKKIVIAGEEKANRAGKSIFFSGQTNLSLLTEDSVNFSTNHQLHWGFSLDGPAPKNVLRVLKNGTATHEVFERALHQYPEFVRNCSAMATITSANQDALLEISRYFQCCGLKGWDWSLFQAIGRGRDREIDIDSSRLIGSWNDLFEAVVDSEFDGFAVSPVLKYLENFINGPGTNMCMRKECGAARDLLSISANGQIEACDCIDPLGPLSNLGNMKETSLAEARDSGVARLIRSRDVSRGDCGECIWLAVCGGTCLARAPGLHGVSQNECQIALNAFDRISDHLARSTRLMEYYDSCYCRAAQG